MSFLYPNLFWIGLPVVALPLIIHLLNLRRQRRVPWAAMHFLLESQERSKTWVNLQELLLLLLRTAALALLVVLLARPTARSGWIGQLLNRPVHHLVVLDDSYSTTDRWAETDAWQQGLGAVADVVQAAADQSSASVVTLLRYSEAQEESDDPRPAIFRQPLDATSRGELLARVESSQPTDGSAGLLAALRHAARLADLQPPDQELVLHLVSDFRQRDLEELDAIEEVLGQIEQTATQVQFVRTVRGMHDNLAITHLAPESGVRAADVEMWMKVAVENFGSTTARDVVVEMHQDGTPLVGVPIGEIAAGETVERRFRVTFAGEGPHWLEGQIDADAVQLDNRRAFATQLPEAQPVLLVDGSPDGWESYYVATALAPGGSTNSGWQPRVVTPLEFASAGSLDAYAAVALLDVPRLDREQFERLAEYVRGGGGLLVTFGESIDREFYTRQGFAEGQGLLPAPPDLPTQWLPSGEAADTGAADLEVTGHPIFRIFEGERNSMLALMRVNYYYSLAAGWQQQRSADTRVLARLAGGQPVVLEKRFGQGKVVQQLTKVSPDAGELGSWSNWGPNPAFVVLVNELFGYLAHGATVDTVLEVGDVVRLRLDRQQYAAGGSLERQGGGVPFQASLEPDPVANGLELLSPPVDRAGLYAVRLERAGGGSERRFAAVNVDPQEGDLQLAADSTLRQKFAGPQFALRYADELSIESNPGESTWSEVLLAALLLALVVEQGLAYVCSFHE